MVGKRRIYERFLSFERFDGAAARQTVVVERRLDQFREQFGDSSQPGSRALVLPVPGLTKHELPARRSGFRGRANSETPLRGPVTF